MPDKLPKGWVKTTLGEIRRDASLGISQQQMRGETFELYSVPAFEERKPEVLPGEKIGSNKITVAPGDVLLCKINPRINRAWVVAEPKGHPQIGSTEWIVFSKQEGIASEFLAYFFAQDTFRNYLSTNVSGVGGSLMRVRPAVVEKYQLNLPPSREQERIVAKLDALLSQISAGEAAARRALERLKRYRAAVLHAAVCGELTRDWRKTHQPKESGPDLLKRLLSARRGRYEVGWLAGMLELLCEEFKSDFYIKSPNSFSRSLQKARDKFALLYETFSRSSSWDGNWEEQWNEFRSKGFSFPNPSSELGWTRATAEHFRREIESLQSGRWRLRPLPDPAQPKLTEAHELPRDWIWASIDQCFQVERGQFSVRPRNDPAYYGGRHPFVQIGDLPREGGIITKYSQTLNEQGLSVSKKFSRGTILIAIVGATIANTGILDFDACCPDSLVAVQTNDVTLRDFADIWLRANKLKLRGLAVASGGQPNINLRILLPFAIALPPLAEQAEVVSKVGRRLVAADRLAATLNRQLDRARATRQSLLREAFAGNLVPQDPKDEPASVLLERIRAAHETECKKPKAKRMPKPKLKTVETLEQLENIVHGLGKGAIPERLLLATGLGDDVDDVEKFFDLLRSGRDKGTLIVPVGKGTVILRA